MPGKSTTKLLNYLPQLFNKNPGTPGSLLTISGAGSPVQLQTGASNLFQVMDAAGFVLDNLFNDIVNAREETYIGVVPVNVNVQYFPTGTLTITDNVGDNITDNVGNPVVGNQVVINIPSQVIDFNFLLYLNAVVGNLNLTLPNPTNPFKQRYIAVKNTGTQAFSLYGFNLQVGQTLLLNWFPQLTIGATTIGGYWQIASFFYFYFNPTTLGTSQILPNPSLPITDTQLGNFATVINLSSNSLKVSNSFINPFESALFQWDNSNFVWNRVLNNMPVELVPIGADSQDGLFYLPGGDNWLNDVGLSFGVQRSGGTVAEPDNFYKNRIRELVSVNKITKPAIQEAITILFNKIPQLFSWYGSDYTQMIPLLTAGFQAFKYNPSTNVMNTYSITGEPNYPNFGPALNWYCVLPKAFTLDLTKAVYADYSYNDWPDGVSPTISNYFVYGGFFEPNPTDAFQTNQNSLLILGQFLERIKAAGTQPIIVINGS